MQRRAPHGARGLKHRLAVEVCAEVASRPARGAWIETSSRAAHPFRVPSRPTRGAWIETEKLGGRIVKSSATFPYRMLFSLGIEKTTALCQNWVRV